MLSSMIRMLERVSRVGSGGIMSNLETQMAALENQWREADELVRAARAELGACQAEHLADNQLQTIKKRINSAERLKQQIMGRIVALEDNMDMLA